MQRLRSQGMMARGFGCPGSPDVWCSPCRSRSIQNHPTNLCGAYRSVEVFAKGGKFLEGPAFDTEGNLWVVEHQVRGRCSGLRAPPTANVRCN